MKPQKNLLKVYFFLAGLFSVISILSVIFPQGPAEMTRVVFFFGIAMAYVFGVTAYTLKVTSRKIEELQTKVEELTRQMNELKQTS